MLSIASRIPSRNWCEVLCIHDLAKDIGLEPFLECAFHYEIDLTTEEIFEIELAVHIVVECLFRLSGT